MLYSFCIKYIGEQSCRAFSAAGTFPFACRSPGKRDTSSMHEFGIAYDIYATARRAALERGARDVKSVHVEFGEMAMVNPEQVSFLYGTLIEDDPVMKDSCLTWSVVPPLTRCACGYEGSERFVCPRCGKFPELVKGREVMVTHMEIEVDDE